MPLFHQMLKAKAAMKVIDGMAFIV